MSQKMDQGIAGSTDSATTTLRCQFCPRSRRAVFFIDVTMRSEDSLPKVDADLYKIALMLDLIAHS